MHCTWFNEKKKKVNFPYIFLWVVSSPNTSPHLSPSSFLPLTTPLGKGAPPPPSPSRGYLAGHLGPRPSWPAASDLARGMCPANPQPDCPRPTEEAHAAGQGPSFVSS